jgi:hypothetical protein
MNIDQISKLFTGAQIEFPNGQQAKVTGVNAAEKTVTLSYSVTPNAVTADPYALFQAMRASMESGPLGPQYDPILSAQQQSAEAAKETTAVIRWADLLAANPQ